MIQITTIKCLQIIDISSQTPIQNNFSGEMHTISDQRNRFTEYSQQMLITEQKIESWNQTTYHWIFHPLI